MAVMIRSIYRKLDETSLAILDVSNYDGRNYIITRINVPAKHRGKGVASELLRECITLADETKTKLFLEISESDGLNRGQLEAWYRRYGFKGSPIGVMIRKPKYG